MFYFGEELSCPICLGEQMDSVDINGLKSVNDNEGHESGDKLMYSDKAMFYSASNDRRR